MEWLEAMQPKLKVLREAKPAGSKKHTYTDDKSSMVKKGASEMGVMIDLLQQKKQPAKITEKDGSEISVQDVNQAKEATNISADAAERIRTMKARETTSIEISRLPWIRVFESKDSTVSKFTS